MFFVSHRRGFRKGAAFALQVFYGISCAAAYAVSPEWLVFLTAFPGQNVDEKVDFSKKSTFMSCFTA
jgi:hypothetical protein